MTVGAGLWFDYINSITDCHEKLPKFVLKTLLDLLDLSNVLAVR
jgi:hypothetical protein